MRRTSAAMRPRPATAPPADRNQRAESTAAPAAAFARTRRPVGAPSARRRTPPSAARSMRMSSQSYGEAPDRPRVDHEAEFRRKRREIGERRGQRGGDPGRLPRPVRKRGHDQIAAPLGVLVGIDEAEAVEHGEKGSVIGFGDGADLQIGSVGEMDLSVAEPLRGRRDPDELARRRPVPTAA